MDLIEGVDSVSIGWFFQPRGWRRVVPRGKDMTPRAIICIIGLSCSVLLGAEQTRAQQVGALPGGCESRFARLDSDRDGRLTLEEFKAVANLSGSPEGLFRIRDLNQDGFLSKQEFCAGKGKRKRPHP